MSQQPPQPPFGFQSPQQPSGPPAYGQPGYGQPGYGQPAYGQPAFGQPAYGQPFPGQPPKPSAGGSKTILFVILGVTAVAGLCVVGFIAALVIPALSAARGAAGRAQSMNNLKQIGIALHNYHDTYKSLPAAFSPDASGNPRASWRTALLPFLDQAPLFSQYDFNVPWDDPRNATVRQAQVPGYLSAREGNAGTNRTDYVVVTSQREASDPSYAQATMFPGGRWIGLRDVADGLSMTIAVVEIKNSDIEWSEPRDIDIDSLSTDPNAPNSIDLAGGALVVFGDGAARQLAPGTTLETLKAMLTRRAGEQIPEL